jgi:TatD DNase family protein
MHLIETHAHLGDEAFKDDRGEVIEKSFSAGVDKIIEIACSAKEWESAAALCAHYPSKIYACFGLHPGSSEELCPENLAGLEQYLKKDCSRGVGEIGLDYYWDAAKKEQQALLLEAMLSVSNRLGLCAVFHARSARDEAQGDAYADLAAALKTKWNYSPRGRRFRGVLHCFSGHERDAVAALDQGLALGINGTFTYKKNDELRGIVRMAGLGKIVFETDCPYLPPQDSRGKRNDPSSLPVIAAAVAAHLGVTDAKAADAACENAREIFGAL